jgi:hypothetical protein
MSGDPYSIEGRHRRHFHCRPVLVRPDGTEPLWHSGCAILSRAIKPHTKDDEWLGQRGRSAKR